MRKILRQARAGRAFKVKPMLWGLKGKVYALPQGAGDQKHLEKSGRIKS